MSNCAILPDQSNASILSRWADRSVLNRPLTRVPGLADLFENLDG
jgi:hypothetical protein